MALRDRLQTLLEPVIESLGYELVLLEFNSSTRHGMLRLFIDRPEGITLDDCERVSHEVSGVLDVEDPISSAYRLEVSSPGMDRPLTKPAHFLRFTGEQVKLDLLAPRNGRRRWTGWIRAVAGDVVQVETEVGMLEIPLVDVDRARLVPVFDREQGS